MDLKQVFTIQKIIDKIQQVLMIFNLKGGVWVGMLTAEMMYLMAWATFNQKSMDNAIITAYIAITGIYGFSKTIKAINDPCDVPTDTPAPTAPEEPKK